MIQPESKAMHGGRKPWVRATLAFVTTAAISVLTACSSMCQRHESAERALDEQSAMLVKLRIERADPRVANKVEADPDLKLSEEHLDRVIEVLIRSNSALKTAF